MPEAVSARQAVLRVAVKEGEARCGAFLLQPPSSQTASL